MKKFLYYCFIFALTVWTLFFGATGVATFYKMSHSFTTLTNEYEKAGAGLGMMIGSGFLIGIWFAGFVALALLILIVKPSKKAS